LFFFFNEFQDSFAVSIESARKKAKRVGNLLLATLSPKRRENEKKKKKEKKERNRRGGLVLHIEGVLLFDFFNCIQAVIDMFFEAVVAK
jgi:hypothetical protein